VVRVSLEAAEDDPMAAQLQVAFWDERLSRSSALVERAIERGELPAGVVPRELVETAAGPIYFRVLFTKGDVGPKYRSEVARRTIRAFS
jgi:hypothetical protein